MITVRRVACVARTVAREGAGRAPFRPDCAAYRDAGLRGARLGGLRRL